MPSPRSPRYFFSYLRCLNQHVKTCRQGDTYYLIPRHPTSDSYNPLVICTSDRFLSDKYQMDISRWNFYENPTVPISEYYLCKINVRWILVDGILLKTRQTKINQIKYGDKIFLPSSVPVGKFSQTEPTKLNKFFSDKRLLGQKSPWTIVPWTNVSLDKRPLDNCSHT